MHPFERRLGDLASVLENCGKVYFQPEPFRRNVNHFLTVSRTVTFLIQKQKIGIKDFERWYSAALSEWRDDELMTWAKEARNYIEKEGDLETFSSLRTTLLYSYLPENDTVIETDRLDLLKSDIDKLMRRALRQLPRGVADAAVVSVERRWIVNAIPAWELLEALTYIYARIHALCASLVRHIGEPMNPKIPDPSLLVSLYASAVKIRYIKVSDFSSNSFKAHRIKSSATPEAPPAFERAMANAGAPAKRTLATMVEHHAEMARITFEQFGSHMSMAFLYDKDWKCITGLPTIFADQADKYIFWRYVGDAVRHLHAHGVIWVAELWYRKAEPSMSLPIREMRIQGEGLQVVGIDAAGGRASAAWTIHRPVAEAPPQLERDVDGITPYSEVNMFFLAPVARAMGIPDEEFLGPRHPPESVMSASQ